MLVHAYCSLHHVSIARLLLIKYELCFAVTNLVDIGLLLGRKLIEQLSGDEFNDWDVIHPSHFFVSEAEEGLH